MRLTKKERIEKILQAATCIFAKSGFKRASTKEIAQDAGCTEALIYKYFKTKKEILEAITFHACDDNDKIYATFFHPMSHLDQSACPLEAFLKKFFYWALNKCFDETQNVLLKVIHRQEHEDVQFAKKLYDFRQKKRISPLAEELRKRQKNHEIKPNIDCWALAVVIYDLLAAIHFKALFLNEDRLSLEKEYGSIFKELAALYSL